MSKTLGHNAVTGSATGSATPTPNALAAATGTANADKAAADKAAATPPNYAKLDKAVTTAFSGAENAFDKVATALCNAHDAEVWKHTTHSVTGKAFGSEAAWIKDRKSGFTILDKTLSKQLMVLLYDRGMSLRAIAEVANVKSHVTVANVVGAATDSDSEATPAPAVDKVALAAKIAKGSENVLQRIADALADMTDDDLAAVVERSVSLSEQAIATERNRRNEAERVRKAAAERSKAAAAKRAAKGKAAATPAAAKSKAATATATATTATAADDRAQAIVAAFNGGKSHGNPTGTATPAAATATATPAAATA